MLGKVRLLPVPLRKWYIAFLDLSYRKLQLVVADKSTVPIRSNYF
jgi:hypothetical protein